MLKVTTLGKELVVNLYVTVYVRRVGFQMSLSSQAVEFFSQTRLAAWLVSTESETERETPTRRTQSRNCRKLERNKRKHETPEKHQRETRVSNASHFLWHA